MGKLKRGNWSTHELERLRHLFPRSSKESVARLLKRSVPSVERKAVEIFSGPIVARDWTATDDMRLRQGYGVVDLEALCLVLGRPMQDVVARIDRLRTRQRAGHPWGRQELRLLKKLYGSRSDEDLVVCLSRGIHEICEKAAALCLSKDKGFLAREMTIVQPMPRWREDEVSLLRDLYPTTANLELARRLDRSVASVANKANQLGLKKNAAILREMGKRNVAARYQSLLAFDESSQALGSQ